MWESIDRLSTIPPFNCRNRLNMEVNLAAHVEKNAEEWYKYVNAKEFLEDFDHKATLQKTAKRRAKAKEKK